MGVTFSEDDGSTVDRKKLRLDEISAQKLITAFVRHSYPPVGNKDELQSLLRAGVACGAKLDVRSFLDATWEVFRENEICHIQEVLSCIALCCEADWNSRLGMIFDIFMSPCTNEICKEDISLGAEVTYQGLLRLWGVVDNNLSPVDLANNREEMQTTCDAISTGAYVKLSRSTEDGIQREEFVRWGAERFKASKTVANKDALVRMYNAI